MVMGIMLAIADPSSALDQRRESSPVHSTSIRGPRLLDLDVSPPNRAAKPAQRILV